MTNPEDAPIEVVARTNPLAMIALAASDPACDVGKLERLMALQERYAANEAKAAWSDALAQFQSKCPPVPKRARGDKGKYAPFEDVMSVAQPVLNECGLSVSFSSEPAGDGQLHIICHIMYGTHTESRDFTCPVPSMINPKTGKAMANEAQTMGMALSYAKRYCVCAALNIICVGEDWDGVPEANKAPAADPNATTAASRGQREISSTLYARWAAADGNEPDGWWPFVAKVIGGAKPAHEMTPDEWDQVAVVIDDMEEATQ